MDGKRVNTENAGNRASALVFGHQHVIVVLGTNKIVETVDEGMKPKDDTPCGKERECKGRRWDKKRLY